jgi:hypothetical protein
MATEADPNEIWKIPSQENWRAVSKRAQGCLCFFQKTSYKMVLYSRRAPATAGGTQDVRESAWLGGCNGFFREDRLRAKMLEAQVHRARQGSCTVNRARRDGDHIPRLEWQRRPIREIDCELPVDNDEQFV